jgi:hypothetical protein
VGIRSVVGKISGQEVEGRKKLFPKIHGGYWSIIKGYLRGRTNPITIAKQLHLHLALHPLTLQKGACK